jgi:hypothetical protein
MRLSCQFTTVIWRGAVTSDVTLSSCKNFEGIIPSSTRNSWPAMKAVMSGIKTLVRQESLLCFPVTPESSGIHWRRRNIWKDCIIRRLLRVRRCEMSKHHSSNREVWHVAAQGNDTPTQNRVAVESEFLVQEQFSLIQIVVICRLDKQTHSNTAFTAVT